MKITFFSIIAILFLFITYKLSASTIPQISGGGYHSLALKSDGTVWAWGDNRFGQLGGGTNKDREKPVQIKNFDVNTMP